MITFYTGTPGSGKSFHLASIVQDYLKNYKCNVIANFEINLDNAALTRIGWLKTRITDWSDGKIKFRRYNKKPLCGRFFYWDNSQITVKNLLAFAKQNHKRRKRSVDQAQTLVLIDEAGIVFNCRGFGDVKRNEWVRFFAKHRHYNFDVILACQFDRQVDKQIRCCVEYEQIHRKLKNYRFLGWLFSTISGGNLFLIHENWYMNHLHIANRLMRYNPRVAALYDTLRDFDDDLGSSVDVLPPGVGGDRGPTAPTPPAQSSGASCPAAEDHAVSTDQQTACNTNSEDRSAAAAPQCVTQQKTLNDKFARWREIMGGGEQNDKGA